MNIEHFPEKKVFQTVVDGETARLMYHVADGALDVRHTIVPGEIGGRGIASALVKAAYDYALANELVPVATCSYAVKWLEKHPEYNGKTGKDYAGEGTCAL
ncbi:GNAT family N-acetyltransferase [Bacteroides cellulosilyticus]|uniref:GNAT family N-acetyltransferase n=1 Tax=Bacteroides cellulosilyticus TaxID=246787 RepID=UPI000E4FB8AC|nr:GNAT family N-acetyltransferase [Bacteroides cellulosilyticus]RGU23028.1 N-acetyltransferase [Bacteroides cellulosilyticus]